MKESLIRFLSSFVAAYVALTLYQRHENKKNGR